LYSLSIIITGGFIMSLKSLAEAIILQSAEDFMDEHRKVEDVDFFGGEGFRSCARLAGMDHADQCAFLNLMRRRATVRRTVAKKTRAIMTPAVTLHF
jgi:hypothetical protein